MRFTKNQKIAMGAVGSLMVIIILGIVYAAFTQQLTINGSATGRSSSWRVYFSSLSNVSLTGTAKELTAPQIDSNNQTSIGDYSVTVTSPGDSVEYTFDVTNSGDYDATLSGLQKTNPSCTGTGNNASTDASNVCGKLTYTLKYADGTNVTQNDTLKSKETKTMKLKLTYETFNDASLLPQADVTITGLGITLTYTQDGNAKVNADGTTPYVDPYPVGGQITVANETYHIISVPSGQDYVVALKDNPLTTSDVNAYESGHVNMYVNSSSEYYQQAKDKNGYGGMAYYTSASCYTIGMGSENSNHTGCTNVYNSSEVKYVVDAWAQAKFTGELKTVDGYSARLISFNEIHSFGYANEPNEASSSFPDAYQKTSNVPEWLYVSGIQYFTMSPYDNSDNGVWYVDGGGNLSGATVYAFGVGDLKTVRPVINVYKSAIQSS